MVRHLFQRTITKKGKSIKAWYYWFYDEYGKQVRRSCGTDGKPCTSKRDAEAFIANLKDDITKESNLTFNQFCDGFYDDDSLFLKKKKARGIVHQGNTVYQKRLYLGYFLKQFGQLPVKKLNVGMVENWLVSLNLSNATRNNILCVVDEIEKELYSMQLIEHIIKVERFKNTSKQKGILTISEIAKLFPADYDDLIKVWRVRTTEKESDIYSFATMIYTILSTGMRSSEIRALQWNQFVRPDAILINAMIDSNRQRVNHLKKGEDSNKKWRVTVLPDKTVKMIDIIRLDKSDNEYVFVYMGQPITTWFLLDHFKIVLERNGINCKERNITIHSLRFTYNSLIKGEISGEDLRLMIGHTSEVMTEYYDRTQALDHLDNLLLNKGKLNNVFGD